MYAKHAKGVTLIELMVVIAVVAILAAAAMPAYRTLLDRYRIGKAAEDVISVISNARAGSVKIQGAKGVVGLDLDGEHAAGRDLAFSIRPGLLHILS